MSVESRGPPPTRRENGLSTDTKQIFRANRHAAVALPSPAATFTVADVPIRRSTLRVFDESGIIEKADAQPDRNRENVDRWTWTPRRRAVEWVAEHLADRPECPGDECHAVGIRTVEAGETYACTRDDCSETFDRETAAEVLDA